ncbi:MAG: hypothetical protein ACE5GE_05815, partial [Phycisphaerae bacterium]
WGVVVPDVVVSFNDSNTPPNVPIHTLGSLNSVDLSIFGARPLHPVHIDFSNEINGDVTRVFPTTGALSLLCREANQPAIPFNRALATGNNPQRIDNGRMPIFDTGLPQDLLYWADRVNLNPTALNIPWGQLIFDYFTALPLDHARTNATGGLNDPTPTVDQGGMRVHGRIDLNSAPWWVIQGIPYLSQVDLDALPGPYPNSQGMASIQEKVFGVLNPDPNLATPIGPELAQSIVAYREARDIGTGTGDYNPTTGVRARNGTGFLTVGELAHVWNIGASTAAYRIDTGKIAGNPNDDFIEAAALLIALGDWVTTRSHVFTVYGTLRGAGTKSAVDKRAVRFQETVDRMPCFFDNKLPQRIGRLVVGDYDNARND